MPKLNIPNPEMKTWEMEGPSGKKEIIKGFKKKEPTPEDMAMAMFEDNEDAKIQKLIELSNFRQTIEPMLAQAVQNAGVYSRAAGARADLTNPAFAHPKAFPDSLWDKVKTAPLGVDVNRLQDNLISQMDMLKDEQQRRDFRQKMVEMFQAMPATERAKFGM